MESNNFKIGEEVNLKVYDYDEDGNESSKEIRGKVYQITNDFVVIDNGYYKESFKYSEFKRDESKVNDNDPYDLSIKSYSQDITNKCVEDIKNEGKGIVFNKEQLGVVLEKLANDKILYSVVPNERIFYIKKI